jgi:hypothetical protein
MMVEKACFCALFPSEKMHHCTVQRSTAPAAEKVSGLPQLLEQWSTITFSLSDNRQATRLCSRAVDPRLGRPPWQRSAPFGRIVPIAFPAFPLDRCVRPQRRRIAQQDAD